MKLGIRIWILGIVVIFSVLLIIQTDSYVKLLIMLMLVGALSALEFSKSKTMGLLLAIVLVGGSIALIYYSTLSGIYISHIDKESDLFKQGLRNGESIVSINGKSVQSSEEYISIVQDIFKDNETIRFDLVTDKNSYTVLSNGSTGVVIDTISKTRIKTGLDLRGGARALVQPDVQITDSELEDLIQVSRNRFNVYGLADVQIKGVSDLEGNKFMLIEIAGATPGDLEELISKQGKFEAKIGNVTVFEGGKSDVSDVCRNKAECAGITACNEDGAGGNICSFRFALYLTEQAAQRHADITRNLSLDPTGQYLSEKLNLYVDDQLVDSLFIGADLKGQNAREISIQGPGEGRSREEAFNTANSNMNKLQTVLITGSLPYKLNIVKLDTISPTLGDSFAYWLIVAGLASIFVVSLIVFVRYRKVKESLAVLSTSLSEIIIILGVASFINWNLDLPSIAGILATIGTGVDQQLVILDEANSKTSLSISQKMKRALFIVFSAFATAAVSLLPLFSAGAGFFKGFAITTLIGITAGVLITRPAFSEIIKKIEN